MREHEILGEVIVADNGSTDGSREIARAEGARLVAVDERGYGRALMGGIAAARGRYVLMGDADDSYDFLELPRFVARLREGHQLVQGCRLGRGGVLAGVGLTLALFPVLTLTYEYRYGLPAQPWLLLAAGLGSAALATGWRARRDGAES